MKISSPYPPEINEALRANNPALEFGEGLALPALALPVRIGEILDFIDSQNDKFIQVGKFRIDVAKYNISNGDDIIELTEKETAILKFLARRKDTVTREDMLKNIWGYSDTVDSKTVENHIYRLRQKIHSQFQSDLIITENGGYKLIEN